MLLKLIAASCPNKKVFPDMRGLSAFVRTLGPQHVFLTFSGEGTCEDFYSLVGKNITISAHKGETIISGSLETLLTIELFGLQLQQLGLK